MAGNFLTRGVAGVGVVRKVPLARMLALAEVIVLAREHVNKLTPHDRRRLVELVKMGRLTRGHLTRRERRELSDLLAKTEPRLFLNRATKSVTGVPLPKRRRA